MARDRRNRPRKQRLARPKKKGLRERRQKHRQLQEAAIALIAKQARLSHDGVAVGYEWQTDHDAVTRRYKRTVCTEEGEIAQYGRWRFHAIDEPANGDMMILTFDGTPPPTEDRGRVGDLSKGYWSGRVVRRWKKIKQRELDVLLTYEWEPQHPKSAVDALGDLARGGM